jgi:hypothetical protein
MRVLHQLRILLMVAAITVAAAYFFRWIGASMLWQAFRGSHPAP